MDGLVEALSGIIDAEREKVRVYEDALAKIANCLCHTGGCIERQMAKRCVVCIAREALAATKPVPVERNSKSHRCGACSAGKHEDCSGWCFCDCEHNR